MAPVNGSGEKKTYDVLLTGFGPFAGYKVNPSWVAVSRLHGTTVETDTHIITFTAFRVPTSYAAILALVPPIHARPPVLPSTQYPPSPTAPDTLPDPDEPPPQPMPAPPPGGYDLVLHVGAGRPGDLAMEVQGHKSGYRIPDVDDSLPPVLEDGDSSLLGGPSEAEQAEQRRVSLAGRFLATIGLSREPLRGFGKGYETFADPLVTGGDVTALAGYLKSRGFEHVRVSRDAGHYCCDFIYYCSLAESLRGRSDKPSRVQFMHVPPPGEPYTVEVFTEAAQGIAQFYSSQV